MSKIMIHLIITKYDKFDYLKMSNKNIQNFQRSKF